MKTSILSAWYQIQERNVLVIGAWDLGFICYLDIVIWDFSSSSIKANSYYRTVLSAKMILQALPGGY